MFSYHRAGPEETKKRREEKKGKGGGRGLAHLPLKSQHHCKPIFRGLQKIEER